MSIREHFLLWAFGLCVGIRRTAAGSRVPFSGAAPFLWQPTEMAISCCPIWPRINTCERFGEGCLLIPGRTEVA